jgi:hypothetical protein
MLETSEASYSYDERVSFIPALDQELVVKALSNIQLLEIQLDLREGDLGELASYNVKFPVIQMYKNAKQYWDHAKSKKTINRIMVEQRHVPRFAMGSVESYGVDRVAPHGHPLLDQFFFSFPENNMDVLIDGERVPMEGNVLLYIPLGSDHGVDVEEGQHMHYVWIDFMVNQDAMNALDKGHIPTGTLRSFNEVESGK